VFVPEALHLCALAPRSFVAGWHRAVPACGGEQQLRVRLKGQRHFDRASAAGWAVQTTLSASVNKVATNVPRGGSQPTCNCSDVRRAKPSVWLTDLRLSCAALLPRHLHRRVSAGRKRGGSAARPRSRRRDSFCRKLGRVQAYCSRRPFVCGIGRPSSRATSNHSETASSAFAKASACDAPCAMQPGNSGTSAMNDASSSLQKIMISYLFSKLVLLKVIPQNDRTNLLHLIWLRFSAITLQVDLLVDSHLAKNVMASARSLFKAKCE
jgi:hypothetical protein